MLLNGYRKTISTIFYASNHNEYHSMWLNYYRNQCLAEGEYLVTKHHHLANQLQAVSEINQLRRKAARNGFHI